MKTMQHSHPSYGNVCGGRSRTGSGYGAAAAPACRQVPRQECQNIPRKQCTTVSRKISKNLLKNLWRVNSLSSSLIQPPISTPSKISFNIFIVARRNLKSTQKNIITKYCYNLRKKSPNVHLQRNLFGQIIRSAVSVVRVTLSTVMLVLLRYPKISMNSKIAKDLQRFQRFPDG